MNINDAKYNKHALVNEMFETAKVVKNIDVEKITAFADKVTKDKILLTGEGSSRIFPAKNCIAAALELGFKEQLVTENSTQALDYKLDDYNVCISSNSGKTKEAVRLMRALQEKNIGPIFGVAANDGTPIITEPTASYLLTCGGEDAVAATKSVIEQALFYDLVFRKRNGAALPDMNKLGDLINEVLAMEVPEEIAGPLTAAETVYFAGRNNGVAEELTLKTNEITRKKSDFLEGTYALHGIEEVMTERDALIIVDPWKEEEGKFTSVMIEGVGLPVAAISTKKTAFNTLVIPEYEGFNNYIQLAAGWNILTEIGVRLGVNIDKPVRARKVGNEMGS